MSDALPTITAITRDLEPLRQKALVDHHQPPSIHSLIFSAVTIIIRNRYRRVIRPGVETLDC
jgi:hypothetical protein